LAAKERKEREEQALYFYAFSVLLRLKGSKYVVDFAWATNPKTQML